MNVDIQQKIETSDDLKQAVVKHKVKKGKDLSKHLGSLYAYHSYIPICFTQRHLLWTHPNYICKHTDAFDLLLCWLPSCFNEDKDQFVRLKSSPLSPYPTLIINPDEPRKYKVLINNTIEITQINCVKEGIATILASYYAFDVKYCPKLTRTLNFLFVQVANIPGMKLSKGNVTFVNNLWIYLINGIYAQWQHFYRYN